MHHMIGTVQIIRRVVADYGLDDFFVVELSFVFHDVLSVVNDLQRGYLLNK